MLPALCTWVFFAYFIEASGLDYFGSGIAPWHTPTRVSHCPWVGFRSLFLFSCIFILLSRESDQCAMRARLGVAGHLSTTSGGGNPAECVSQRHNK